MCSVLAARPLQGNACSERDDTAEVVPGSGRTGAGAGIQGPHFPVAIGKEPGEKKGQGGQLTKGLWLCPGKNNREGPSEGPQLSRPHHNTHAYSEQRGAQHILSSKSVFQQSQKSLSCSRVFCLIRQYTFYINFLNGFILNLQRTPPPQERTHHAGGF